MLTIHPTLTLHTHPLAAYAAAFREYADIGHNAFEIRSYGEHALVRCQDEIYQVSHFDDIKNAYQSYFRMTNGGLIICIELPAEFWTYFLKNKVRLSIDDLVIDLYLASKHSWERPISARDHPDDYRELYFEEFKLFATNLLNTQTSILLDVANLDDEDYLPIVAKAIKNLYKNEADFFTDCASIMTHHFPENFGNGSLSEMVNLNPYQYAPEDTYYIYSVNEDF